jgi:hypothetical protein
MVIGSRIQKTNRKATSSSHNVLHSGSKVNTAGWKVPFRESLCPTAIGVRKTGIEAELLSRFQGMCSLNFHTNFIIVIALSDSEHIKFTLMGVLPKDQTDDQCELDNILDGQECMEVSHAGGEFSVAWEDMEDEIRDARPT